MIHDTPHAWPIGGPARPPIRQHRIASICLLLGVATWLTAGVASDVAPSLRTQAGIQGGLVVHIGCSSAPDAALGLRTHPSFLVQGLERDPGRIGQTRQAMRPAGDDRPVSVAWWDGTTLPYIDNVVNAVIHSDTIPLPEAEIRRVLTPGGAAFTLNPGTGTLALAFRKPIPPTLDDWTHFLHGPDNNAVSQDTVVAPPQGLRWWCGPPSTRHHERASSINAMVSAGGRMFYVFDEGSPLDIFLPPRWMLIARDAHNGSLLWKQELRGWIDAMFNYKFSQPAFVARKLVAIGNQVYVPLHENGPVSVLDAATGEVLHTLAGTDGAYELLVDGNTLYAVTVAEPQTQVFTANRLPTGGRALVAVDLPSQALRWRRIVPSLTKLTLAAGPEALYYHDGEAIQACGATDGALLWRSAPVETTKSFLSKIHEGPTLVYQDGRIFYSGGTRTMQALDARTGAGIWTAKHQASGSASPEDLLVVNGGVWHADIRSPSRTCGPFEITDAATGQVVKSLLPDLDMQWFHHRCHRAKATVRYYLSSHTGIEFVDMDTGSIDANNWVRGACLYGIMPANGLVYAPQAPCACYPGTRIRGMSALTATSAYDAEVAHNTRRLERGPAWPQRQLPADAASPHEWPAYRHDIQRSGATPGPAPTKPVLLWRQPTGRSPTPPIMAGGAVFVADKQTGTITALDATHGTRLWSCATGGPIDSAPLWFEGFLYAGCSDGRVVCLDATTGAIAWSYLAAPLDRRMIADNRIESAWPVCGSVLIATEPKSARPAVWALAGRNMFLDGGLFLTLLDARTGEPLASHRYDHRDPTTGADMQLLYKTETFQLPSTVNDILVEAGGLVFLGKQPFLLDGQRERFDNPGTFQDAAGKTTGVTIRDNEVEHLVAYQRLDRHPRVHPSAGFLDDSFFHRNAWTFGGNTYAAGNIMASGQVLPYGSLLVHNETKVFGFGRSADDMAWRDTVRWRIFRSDKTPDLTSVNKPSRGKFLEQVQKRFATDWEIQAPLFVRAMVKTATSLICAGPPILVDTTKLKPGAAVDPPTREQLALMQAAIDGKAPSLLCLFDAETGAEHHRIPLDAAPVFDGMSVAQGRIYLSAQDGTVSCFGDPPTTP